MSNPTESPRENGGGNKRRRRSRGGQNRRNNENNSNRDGEPRRQRNSGGPSAPRGQGAQSGPSSQGGGKPQRRPMPQPAPLTWWQKLLKAIGLYKEPVKPQRKPRPVSEETAPRPPKSNTRIARTEKSADAAPAARTEKFAEAPEGDRPPRKPRQRSGEGRIGGDPSSVESARVYVGNLSYDATEQDLQELFKGIGSVRNVEVVYDRKTHRSKGFGFVEMIHVDEAKRAVEVLHDQFFMGREMVVSGAKKKGQDEREDQDEVRAEKPKPIELAPLPPAASEPVVADAAPAEAEALDSSALSDPSDPERPPSA
jgi:hypothetical protein